MRRVDRVKRTARSRGLQWTTSKSLGWKYRGWPCAVHANGHSLANQSSTPHVPSPNLALVKRTCVAETYVSLCLARVSCSAATTMPWDSSCSRRNRALPTKAPACASSALASSCGYNVWTLMVTNFAASTPRLDCREERSLWGSNPKNDANCAGSGRGARGGRLSHRPWCSNVGQA